MPTEDLSSKIDILFDGPPGPVPGRFVEVEDSVSRQSIGAGEWLQRDDGYWVLRIESPPESDDKVSPALEALVTMMFDEFGPGGVTDYVEARWVQMRRDIEAVVDADVPSEAVAADVFGNAAILTDRLPDPDDEVMYEPGPDTPLRDIEYGQNTRVSSYSSAEARPENTVGPAKVAATNFHDQFEVPLKDACDGCGTPEGNEHGQLCPTRYPIPGEPKTPFQEVVDRIKELFEDTEYDIIPLDEFRRRDEAEYEYDIEEQFFGCRADDLPDGMSCDERLYARVYFDVDPDEDGYGVYFDTCMDHFLGIVKKLEGRGYVLDDIQPYNAIARYHGVQGEKIRATLLGGLRSRVLAPSPVDPRSNL